MNHYQDWLKQHVRKLDGSEMSNQEFDALTDEDWHLITTTYNTYLAEQALIAMYNGLSRLPHRSYGKIDATTAK